MKKIEIVPYDSSWPKTFKTYEKQLRELLRENCIDVHHIGSTSVPGLSAKPKIDILCVVKDLKSTIASLEQGGYKFGGEFNLPLRLFFSKRDPDSINLHVVNESSGEIEWNLTFRNYLRENKDARELYENTKIRLLKENPDGFKIVGCALPEYTVMKGKVIREIAEKAGFTGYRFVIASNYDELDDYKKLMNLETLNLDNKNIFNLCLYKGTSLAAAACLELERENSTVNIKTIKSLSKKDLIVFQNKIREWLNFHNWTEK